MNIVRRIFNNPLFSWGDSHAEPVKRISGVPSSGGSSVPRSNTIGRRAWMFDEGAMLGDFYSYIRRRVPVISNGIAAWVDLSTSGNQVNLEEGSDAQQRKAQDILKALDDRVWEYDFCGGAGFSALLEYFYLSLYMNGRVAFEMVPYRDMSGIAYVAIVNPFSIVMRRDGDKVNLYQKRDDSEELIPLPNERIFYAAFDPDSKHPQGISILDSITWVVEIKEKLIEDMARASHNAGYPRLHVGVAPPERIQGETPASYSARANTEFDDTVDAFRDLDVDDNIFTWSNVEVTIVGGQATGQVSAFNWSVNVDRVNDEVVAGLRLYPWVVGISAATTKNWVDSQHDLLMQRVQRGAQHGARFMDWIRNTELRLAGSPVRTSQSFKPTRDPGKLIQERAATFEFTRIDQMVQRGYISKDDGARLLGLRRAYNQNGGESSDDSQ